jgi:hypothetical protein
MSSRQSVWPHAPKPYWEIVYHDFPMHQSFASGISDSRFPIYRHVFRFTLRGQVRSCDLHSYDHSHTILSGSRGLKFHNAWTPCPRDSRSLESRFPTDDFSIGTFPMNLHHRWIYSLSGLSPMAQISATCPLI